MRTKSSIENLYAGTEKAPTNTIYWLFVSESLLILYLGYCGYKEAGGEMEKLGRAGGAVQYEIWKSVGVMGAGVHRGASTPIQLVIRSATNSKLDTLTDQWINVGKGDFASGNIF